MVWGLVSALRGILNNNLRISPQKNLINLELVLGAEPDSADPQAIEHLAFHNGIQNMRSSSVDTESQLPVKTRETWIRLESCRLARPHKAAAEYRKYKK